MNQRGVALISAMIVVALATVIAASLFFDSAMTARRSAASFSMEQGLQLAQGAEALAAAALQQSGAPTQVTTAGTWAQHYGPVEVAPEVSLEAQLNDEQGKFNLNTLLKKDGTPNKDAVAVFNQLLKLVELEPRWTSLLIDWMDANTQTTGSDGGEDSLYASQTPPHRTGNLLLTSISELQQMPGFTREMYLRLSPFVTALPPSANKINVCTADGVVLDALFAVSTDDANNIEYSRMRPEDLATSRAQICFPTLQALTRGDAAMNALAGETSNYFRLRTWVRIGTAQFALYSLMYREGDKARPIMRTFGTD
ncbi:MAG: type II secretion system minor pseudopilin GspK [Pseudomonadota bacterium]